jgi:voltage-gated potassium channel
LPEQKIAILDIMDIIILIIFAIDYFTRLILAKGKWSFIKSNIPDLLSIIPFNQVFQVLRVFRIFKLMRLVKLTRLGKAARLFSVFTKFGDKASEFLKTNNFIYAAYITSATILFGTVGISYTENLDFGNALWWAIVTTTTVGYGDISPKTALGKLIAVILMIVGIGFLGMLTGTISTYFIRKLKKPECEAETSINNVISLDGLSEDEIKNVKSYVRFLKINLICNNISASSHHNDCLQIELYQQKVMHKAKKP